MSRFDEHFERDLGAIAERVTPSPDAWSEIQQRIADRAPRPETEIIMLVENPKTPTRRWPLLAAAAAVAALAIGAIALVNRDGDDQLPADEPDPVPTVAPDVDEGAEPGADAADIPMQGSTVEPGTYTADMLGIPVGFEVPDTTSGPWTVTDRNGAGFSIRTERGFVGMTRIGSFYDSTQSQTLGMSGLGSIPPDGIDTWIDANGVVVDASDDVTVDGRTAEFRQVRAPAGSGAELCPEEAQPCILVGSGSADRLDVNSGAAAALGGDIANAFWIIELDDFEPLGIWAAAFEGDIDGWLDELAPLIASIELGEPAPAIEGGTARISTFESGPTALAFPPPGAVLEPARYASDALGVPIELELGVGETAPWALMNEEPGRLWFISDGSDQEFVAIGRLGSWYDEIEARTEDTTGLGSIPPDDIDAWIARNGIIVVGQATVEVGGRPAEYRQIRLDTTPGATADFCGASAPCLWASTGSQDVVGGTANPLEVGYDRAQSVWLIDMDEFEPVYIFAAAQLGDDGDQAWFADVVQPIVDSITFGAPAPTVEGGTARVPERADRFASYTGTRTVGPELADGTREVTGQNTVVGDLTGELVSTGVQLTPTNGVDDLVFTGTIDGLGTGTLTMRQEWTATNDDIATRTFVTGGTGDFEGFTGRVITSVDVPDESGPDPVYSGRMTFELAIPRTG